MLGAGLRTDQLQNSLWNVREQQITVFLKILATLKSLKITGFSRAFTVKSRVFHGLFTVFGSITIFIIRV
jgi:hypothetical protein